MSNLTPEVRADKNGKLVTRHVKSGFLIPYESKGFPSPTVEGTKFAAAREHSETINKIQDAVSEAFISGDYSWQTQLPLFELNAQCLDLEPRVASAFRQRIEDDPDGGWRDLLISVLDNKLESKEAGNVLFVAQHFYDEDHMDNEWNMGVGGTESYDETRKVYNGLTSFSKDTGRNLPQSFLDTDEATQKQWGAVMRALNLGKREGCWYVAPDWDRSMIIFDDDAVAVGELAMDYPDDIHRVHSIIMERDMDVVDREFIASILDSEAASMSEGIL